MSEIHGRNTNTKFTKPLMYAPRAPRLVIAPELHRQMQAAKRLHGIRFMRLASAVEASPATFVPLFAGRGRATHRSLEIVARVVAILGADPTRAIVERDLPRVPDSLVIADLRRLKKLSLSPFAHRFCSQRLAEIQLRNPITVDDPVAAVACNAGVALNG